MYEYVRKNRDKFKRSRIEVPQIITAFRNPGMNVINIVHPSVNYKPGQQEEHSNLIPDRSSISMNSMSASAFESKSAVSGGSSLYDYGFQVKEPEPRSKRLIGDTHRTKNVKIKGRNLGKYAKSRKHPITAYDVKEEKLESSYSNKYSLHKTISTLKHPTNYSQNYSQNNRELPLTQQNSQISHNSLLDIKQREFQSSSYDTADFLSQKGHSYSSISDDKEHHIQNCCDNILKSENIGGKLEVEKYEGGIIGMLEKNKRGTNKITDSYINREYDFHSQSSHTRGSTNKEKDEIVNEIFNKKSKTGICKQGTIYKLIIVNNLLDSNLDIVEERRKTYPGFSIPISSNSRLTSAIQGDISGNINPATKILNKRYSMGAQMKREDIIDLGYLNLWKLLMP